MKKLIFLSILFVLTKTVASQQFYEDYAKPFLYQSNYEYRFPGLDSLTIYKIENAANDTTKHLRFYFVDDFPSLLKFYPKAVNDEIIFIKKKGDFELVDSKSQEIVDDFLSKQILISNRKSVCVLQSDLKSTLYQKFSDSMNFKANLNFFYNKNIKRDSIEVKLCGAQLLYVNGKIQKKFIFDYHIEDQKLKYSQILHERDHNKEFMMQYFPVDENSKYTIMVFDSISNFENDKKLFSHLPSKLFSIKSLNIGSTQRIEEKFVTYNIYNEKFVETIGDKVLFTFKNFNCNFTEEEKDWVCKKYFYVVFDQNYSLIGFGYEPEDLNYLDIKYED